MTRRLSAVTVLACLACLLGCLFETRAPRTVPLVADGEFARFDPLIITFVDSGGNIRDTLFRGPGNMGWDRRLAVEGLDDSGSIRMEGYAEGELRFRLDIPWPADTLFASPRWTPVGGRLADFDFEYLSMEFDDGKPIAYGYYPYTSILEESDGEDWRWSPVPVATADGLPLYIWNSVLVSNQADLLLVDVVPFLHVRKRISGQWYPAMSDTNFQGAASDGPNAMAYDSGILAVATGRWSTVKYAQYESEADWANTETRIFRNYALPGYNWSSYLRPGPRLPALACIRGEAALILRQADSAAENPGMKLFRKRDGVWDSTPAFPTVYEPSLALEDDEVYMAFVDDVLEENTTIPYGRIHLRKLGADGWEDVGPRDIFGFEGYSPVLKIRQGMSFILARAEGYRVARLRDGKWETLVEPRFQDFTWVLDFDVDEAGTPYLAVIDREDNTRIVKFVDPHLP